MKHTEKELTLLREEVSQMWGLVLSQLEKARQAYLNNDAELAREVASRMLFLEKAKIRVDAPTEEFFTSVEDERLQQFLSVILKH